LAGKVPHGKEGIECQKEDIGLQYEALTILGDVLGREGNDAQEA